MATIDGKSELEFYLECLKNNRNDRNKVFLYGALTKDMEAFKVLSREGRLPCYKAEMAILNYQTGECNYIPVEITDYPDLNLKSLKEGHTLSVYGMLRNAPKHQRNSDLPERFVLVKKLDRGSNYYKEYTGRSDITNNLILLDGNMFYNGEATLLDKFLTIKNINRNDRTQQAFRYSFPGFTENQELINFVENHNGQLARAKGYLYNPGHNPSDTSICIESIWQPPTLKKHR